MALSKTFPIGSPLTASDVNEHLVNQVPAPGDPYDTGWVPLVLAPGVQPRPGHVPAVRRIGQIVYQQDWQFLPFDIPGGTPIFATIPMDFLPEAEVRVTGFQTGRAEKLNFWVSVVSQGIVFHQAATPFDSATAHFAVICPPWVKGD